MESTSETLLDQLQLPGAAGAWERFCRVYGPPIIRYAQKLGLAEADARDVMQESLLVLIRLLPRFRYDPARGRFRNYLLTIVHRQALAHQRRAGRVTALPPEEIERLNEPLPVEAGPADDRWQEALLDEAWQQLQASGRLKPDTIAAFEAYAIRGAPCADVAKNWGMTENTVYQIRNRVIAMLKEDVRRLMADLDREDGHAG